MTQAILSRNALYFLKCFEVLSFSKAARELHVSQSTLSLALKAFEDQLGQSLFIRGRGNVDIKPTAYAHRLAGELKQIRKELHAKLDTDLQQLESVKIATVQYFSRTHLLPALRSLKLFDDHKIFIVRTNKALGAVKAQDVDVAFVLSKTAPLKQKNLCIEIKTEKIGVIGAKNKFSHILKAKSLDDLKNEPWIIGDRVREDWSESLNENKNSYYIEDHFSARFLVLEGYGIAQLQLDYFSEEEMKNLVVSKVRLPFQGLKLYAVLRKNLPAEVEHKILSLVKHIKVGVS